MADKMYSRVINAWCMYDWANSAFATTVMGAVLPTFYSAVAGAGLKDEAEVDQWAQQQGLQAGQFKRVNDEFTKRMGTNRALTNRFGMLYAQG